MSDYSPLYLPGQLVTFVASAPVTGGQAVVISGNNTVAPAAGATTKYIGVAAYDAAAGMQVTVVCRGVVHISTVAGAVTAGDDLVTAAAGKVSSLAAASGATAGDINSARSVIGTALITAADATKVEWMQH